MVDILTPVGRIVQGHPMTENTKGFGGKPLTTKAGDPRIQYFFALAIRKDDPGWGEVYRQFTEEAAKFKNGEYNRKDFAWKTLDGDAPENVSKEGFAGHWVLRISGGFPPKVYTAGGAQQIVEKSQIKCGDYARVYLNVAINGDSNKPGLYLNPVLVELIGYGDAIVGGPDPREAFKQAASLPPGASHTPVASGPGIAAPGLPGPAPVAAPAPAPPAPAPAPEFLAPPPKRMTAKAGGLSYDAYVKAGWTDKMLVDHGYMEAF